MIWNVHKFGGSSVKDANCFQQVARILRTLPKQKFDCGTAVVVSAMGGITDQLINLTQTAVSGDSAFSERLESIRNRHVDVAQTLLDSERCQSFCSSLEQNCKDLQEILRGLSLLKSHSERAIEFISGYGELWSAQLLNFYLQSIGLKSQWLDAREVLRVEAQANNVLVNWSASQLNLDKQLKKDTSDFLVITGYIASTMEGVPTTLKRNGSDYSASIFASLLNAKEVYIWTDVSGVYSADPRWVPEAVPLEELTYNEATELAYFGAKVLHPSTMAPAIAKEIPIWIRNTFQPDHPGTKIHSHARSDKPVKGFASISDVALVNLEGTGLIGIPGIAERLFGSLKDVNISVIMISQASSEHSICFVIPENQIPLAREAIESIFYGELQRGQIQSLSFSSSCTVLAAVGDNMVNSPGIAAKFFSALAHANVNVRAIAQGSSERNISAVIDKKDTTKALRAVHAGFFLSNQTLSVGIIGTGWIGKTLIEQIATERQSLIDHHKIDLRIRALSNSTTMVLSEESLNINSLEAMTSSHQGELNSGVENLHLPKFIQHLQSDYLPHAVVIDCTASEVIAEKYSDWLELGLNIITPNKKANTDTIEKYNHLKSTVKRCKKHYLYETTVGAGLPIINTLRDLVQTGDQIYQVEGILSGTLSYIFNQLSTDTPFSSVVLKAKAMGYTEPDPRDDLSGLDVARKLVILAREMNLQIDLKDVKLEGLVPAHLLSLPLKEFMESLPNLDPSFAEALQQVAHRNEVLRYVGTIDENGVATVALKSYPRDHSFAHLSGTDNIVAFQTRRYREQPLIVRGPGAGPQVTAAGVFADLLRLSTYLGGSI